MCLDWLLIEVNRISPPVQTGCVLLSPEQREKEAVKVKEKREVSGFADT